MRKKCNPNIDIFLIIFINLFLASDFRKFLIKIEEENASLKVENASIKAYHNQQAQKVNFFKCFNNNNIIV